MQRNPRNSLTASRLRKVLYYDPQTGLFVWIKPPRGRRLLGRIAGTINHQGYRHIAVDGVIYKASRLAWLYMTGKWPSEEIDHKNGNQGDDQFSNLRDVTRSENGRNRGLQKNNSTGFTGVHRCRNKFAAKIKHDNKMIHIGVFETAEEAARAYLARAAVLHGEFSRAVVRANNDR